MNKTIYVPDPERWDQIAVQANRAGLSMSGLIWYLLLLWSDGEFAKLQDRDPRR